MSATTSPGDRLARAARRVIAGGFPRSFVIGSAFSVAWSPCIGPILGVVLTLAAASGTAYQGALLLTCYSLGLGVWFLAFGAGFGWLSPRMRRLSPYLPALMVVSGAVFIVLGALMFLGHFARLNAYFQGLGFLFSSTAATETSLSGGVQGWFGPAIAFFGGVVSFLSPCMLPLVPAYLVNIAGEAVLATGEARGSRLHVIGHAAAFVIGFTVVFAFVGASAGLLGNLVSDRLDTLTRGGGIVLIILGMQMSGLIHIPFMARTYQVRV